VNGVRKIDRRVLFGIFFYFILLILFASLQLGKRPDIPGFNVFIYLSTRRVQNKTGNVRKNTSITINIFT